MSKIPKENKSSGGVKKTVLTVLSVLLILILIAAAILGYRFRSHIKAAVIWLTTSDEDIQKNIDKAKDEQTEVLSNSGFYASKELDEALMSGKITAEEHTQILIGSMTLEEVLANKSDSTQTVPDDTILPDGTNSQKNPPVSDTQKEPQADDSENEPDVPAQSEQKTDDGKQDVPKQPQQNEVPSTDKKEESNNPNAPPAGQTQAPAQTASEADKRIAELVTKMYVLKSEYTVAVEGVVASMKADFVKLPPEQRTLSAKQSIATGYLGTINSMEAQCDAQVNAIVTELRKLLKDNGRDMSLADAILSTYATEKENTKAYYLSTYGD